MKIETYKEYQLYLKKFLKTRDAEKELEELLLFAFKQGIDFNQQRLKVEL